MSASNATENDVLEMLCKGTDPSWRAGATGYWALFTGDPGESGSLAAECAYTGYARVAQTKSSAWTDNGSSFVNAALVQWGLCTAGTETATHFAWVDTPSGAVGMMVSGALTASLAISAGIRPQADAGELELTAN